MSTPIVVGTVLLAVLVFWCVGAYNRLSAVRDKLVRRFVEADRVLRVRRKAMLAWVAATQEQGPLLPGTEAVVHACTQADAAGEKARTQPTARGLIGSLNMAEQVLERTMRDFMQQPSAGAVANRRAAWVATEVQLAVARQVFNREVLAYNEAVRQFPASIVARLIGLAPTLSLEAGAELSPAGALAAAPSIEAPIDASTIARVGVTGIVAAASAAVQPGSGGPIEAPTTSDTPEASPQTGDLHADPISAGADAALDAGNLGHSDFPVGLDTAVLEGTVERIAAATTPGVLDARESELEDSVASGLDGAVTSPTDAADATEPTARDRAPARP